MTRINFPISLRSSLWKANKQCCFFCGSPLEFYELEIDHIIPLSISKKSFKEIKEILELGNDFNLNSTENLVPSHNNCNRRKSDDIFNNQALVYYFNIWKLKQGIIKKLIQKFNIGARNNELLTKLVTAVENNELSILEINQFVKRQKLLSKNNSSEPTVLSLSINMIELLNKHKELREVNFIKLCDDLEEKMICEISKLKCIKILSEEDRNGECCMLRFVLWNLNVDNLGEINFFDWDVMEILPYSEIYEDDWDQLYIKAIVEDYHKTIHDPNEPYFGLRCCPNCGSIRLTIKTSSSVRENHTYSVINCEDCDWKDFTE